MKQDMVRSEKVAMAQTLRAEGLTNREIAGQMGVSIAAVKMWFWDTDGSKMKALREKYRGTCEKCGAPTCGSRGPAKAPRLCANCYPLPARRRPITGKEWQL